MSEHLEQIEKSKTAILLIDKILPHLPDYGRFHLAYYARDVLKWSSEEIRELVSHRYQIINLMLNHFQYINEITEGYYYELNNEGRAAKAAGGHFAYLKFIDEQKENENKRRERKDKSDEFDLLLKQWQVKTKLLPYAVSILALTVSIFSYFKPEKKQTDLLQVQQKIQELQQHVNKQDSLFQSDTLQTKHKK